MFGGTVTLEMKGRDMKLLLQRVCSPNMWWRKFDRFSLPEQEWASPVFYFAFRLPHG